MTDDILDILRAQPATLDALARTLGQPRRAIEAAIQELRLAGHPIVSDGTGIRLARDSRDALRCAERLRERARHQLRTAVALRRAGQRLADQEASIGRLTLWDAA